MKRTKYILIMHVAQVYFGSGIRPVPWVLEFKAHLLHERCNFFIIHGLPIDIGLFGNDLEFSSLVTTKS